METSTLPAYDANPILVGRLNGCMHKASINTEYAIEQSAFAGRLLATTIIDALLQR